MPREQISFPVNAVEQTEFSTSLAEFIKSPSAEKGEKKELVLKAVKFYRLNKFGAQSTASAGDSSKELNELKDELEAKKEFIRGLENIIEEQKETITSSHNQNIELANTNATLNERLNESFLLVKSEVQTAIDAMERRIAANLSKSPEDFINQMHRVAKQVCGAKDLL